jgi:transposase
LGRKESTVRPQYPLEYRQQIVELVRAGRSPKALAQEFEPSEQTIRNWVRQAALDSGQRTDGLTTEERAELRQLRRENRQLKLEREILKKAAAWFARETGTLPERDSSS